MPAATPNAAPPESAVLPEATAIAAAPAETASQSAIRSQEPLLPPWGAAGKRDSEQRESADRDRDGEAFAPLEAGAGENGASTGFTIGAPAATLGVCSSR